MLAGKYLCANVILLDVIKLEIRWLKTLCCDLKSKLVIAPVVFKQRDAEQKVLFTIRL